MTIQLQTERLRLEPWRVEALDAFHAIWGDPDVIWWGPDRTLAESRARLEEAISDSDAYPEGFGWFAVVERQDGNVCGNVFIQPYGYGDGWEIGYHFARARQGRGFATEAVRGLIDHAFTTGVARVVALVLADNLSSQRVCARLGLRKTGTQMHAGLLHDVLEIRGDDSAAEGAIP